MEFLLKPSSPQKATNDDANAAAATVSGEDVAQTDSQGQEISIEERVAL